VSRTDLFSLRALRFHVPLVLGIAVCLYAGWFELRRALDGRTIAWVYAFEWPGFAIAGVVIWWRIITDRDAPRPGGPDAEHADRIPDDDPGLVAWQEYRDGLERDALRRSDDAL
jgi:hypothetical protein